MPALLAPLEALEDLIPIFGEIADLVEIAATPAIIEACVKGIEKEGKAEFKVFGKKHTLTPSMARYFNIPGDVKLTAVGRFSREATRDKTTRVETQLGVDK